MSIVDIHAPAGEGYGIIYADPPWSYRQQGNGAAARHYKTMTPDEIKAPARPNHGRQRLCPLDVGHVPKPPASTGHDPRLGL